MALIAGSQTGESRGALDFTQDDTGFKEAISPHSLMQSREPEVPGKEMVILLRLNLKIAVKYECECGSYVRSVCNLLRRFVKKAPVILVRVQEGTPVVSCTINVPR